MPSDWKSQEEETLERARENDLICLSSSPLWEISSPGNRHSPEGENPTENSLPNRSAVERISSRKIEMIMVSHQIVLVLGSFRLRSKWTI
jgi:hypothetical protein